MKILPRIIFEKVGNVFVARDDYLPGGTKRRAVQVFMDDAEELVYASPAQGYAQVALAHGGKDHNKKVTIFVAQRKELHPLTQEAQKQGAKIIQVPMGYLSNVTSKAKLYCETTPGAKLLPFGLRDDRFINKLSSVMKQYANMQEIFPTELWTVASSGTIALAMQKAWPRLVLHCVQVGHKVDLDNIVLHIAPERYEQGAKIKPPFNSCINYDAKAWRFVREFAKDGALFWNVGA